jgi:hypothetical protein
MVSHLLEDTFPNVYEDIKQGEASNLVFYFTFSGLSSGFALSANSLINLIQQVRPMKSDDVRPEAICGYCTQGKHYECRGYDCECAKTGHS